jgi:hypothetical protein
LPKEVAEALKAINRESEHRTPEWAKVFTAFNDAWKRLTLFAPA